MRIPAIAPQEISDKKAAFPAPSRICRSPEFGEFSAMVNDMKAAGAAADLVRPPSDPPKYGVRK
jgi:hypothetical protein